MPQAKMIPPLPDTFGKTEHDRFKRFAKALLAVPKPEVAPEETVAKLEIEKQEIESKLKAVRRELKKRNTRPSS
jgi:hypothetical protein